MTTQQSVHEVSFHCERGPYMLHSGHRARCSCGWESDCYSQMGDTQRAVEVHLRRAEHQRFDGTIAWSSIGAAFAVGLERALHPQRRKPVRRKAVQR